MTRAVIAVAWLVIAFLALMAGVSTAHDEADWIQKQGLRNAAGEWCCGKGDCVILEYSPSISAAGYLLEGGEIVPHSEVQPSPTKRYVRCHRPDGSRRCFFAPPNSM